MKRIAAYCRVSTEQDDQVNSLENQKRYFNESISRNPEWQLVKLYADEGITGTNTKKRKAFNQMVEDAKMGLFDMIVTKEISRFARNTLDSIFYTRELKSWGVGVFFLNDNINTLDPDSELRLTIISSIAQEESRKTSQRVKWGQKRSMEYGVAFGHYLLGYDFEKGKLTVNENEAQTVRMIFKKYLDEGKGVNSIAKELENEGYRTKTGCKHWQGSALLRILKNEKYCGDLLQMKTFTPDFLNHKSQPNKGEEEFILVQNNHDPIISRELFDRTQEEIKRRAVNQKENHIKYSNRYTFSGRIECGCCGHKFVGRRRKRPNGTVYRTWQCGENARYGNPKVNKQGELTGCENGSLSDEVFKQLFLITLDKVTGEKEIIKKRIKQSLSGVLNGSDIQEENQKEIEKLQNEYHKTEEKKTNVIDCYMEGTITKEELQAMKKRYDGDLERIQNRLSKLHKAQTSNINPSELIGRIEQAIDSLVNCETFNEEVCKQMLDKIIVHDRQNIEVFINGVDKPVLEQIEKMGLARNVFCRKSLFAVLPALPTTQSN